MTSEVTGGPRGARALYVHVPFCRSICGYCDFNVSLASAAPKAALAAAMSAEIALRDLTPGSFTSVLIGGGTPSALDPAELRRLLHTVAALVGSGSSESASRAEWTLECNPEDVTDDLLAACSEAGVTRVSVGVQSLADSALARLDRRHTGEMAIRAIRSAQDRGLVVSIDLLCGVPGHAGPEWSRQLDGLLEVRPDHVSVYALSGALADHEGAARQLRAAAARLADAGLARYDISNFAREGHRSAQHLVVMRGGDYVGLGPGASSRRGPARRQNRTTWAEYEAAARAGADPVRDTNTPSGPDGALDDLLLGLHLVEGAEPSVIANRWGLSVGSGLERLIGHLVDAERIVRAGERIRLADTELDEADDVLSRIVACGWT